MEDHKKQNYGQNRVNPAHFAEREVVDFPAAEVCVLQEGHHKQDKSEDYNLALFLKMLDDKLPFHQYSMAAPNKNF